MYVDVLALKIGGSTGTYPRGKNLNNERLTLREKEERITDSPESKISFSDTFELTLGINKPKKLHSESGSRTPAISALQLKARDPNRWTNSDGLD